MATNRLDNSRLNPGNANGSNPGARAEETAPADTAPAASGGFAAWLPLIVTVVAMPVLAYATTTFLLLPKLQQTLAGHAGTETSEATAGPSDTSAGATAPAKQKFSVPLSKIIVNVSGTMGTRYLMTSVSLAGSAQNFRQIIDNQRDQLLDVANSTLRSKTIADLEKPGAMNQVRTELISVFNNALGGNIVQELYITEFAIQ